MNIKNEGYNELLYDLQETFTLAYTVITRKLCNWKTTLKQYLVYLMLSQSK